MTDSTPERSATQQPADASAAPPTSAPDVAAPAAQPAPQRRHDNAAAPQAAAAPSAGRGRVDLDQRLAAEIEDALGDMSVADMLDLDTPNRPQRDQRDSRERRTGTIMQVHGHDVFVEFGPRSQGVCALSMFESTPALGASMEFIVERYDKEDGLLILSRQGTVQKAEWESLEPGQVVEARCTGVNKGGLEMEVANHRAFMPAGQVDIRHIADLSVFIGEKMPCEVVEVDRARGRIILSRKSAVQQERAILRDQLLATLEVGQMLPATITTIQPYGAFADLGGVDGLIHISDLAYERLKHPSEVVKEGQQVQVKVLKIDQSQVPPRIGLGLKQTMENPAIAARASLKEGETVTGRVTRLMPFGAFVELGPGVEGLIHISELAHERVHDVRKVVKPDEIVPVKILSVDPRGKKISLSLKQTKEKSEEFQARKQDRKMEKLRSQLNSKWGAIPLKGGLG